MCHQVGKVLGDVVYAGDDGTVTTTAMYVCTYVLQNENEWNESICDCVILFPKREFLKIKCKDDDDSSKEEWIAIVAVRPCCLGRSFAVNVWTTSAIVVPSKFK